MALAVQTLGQLLGQGAQPAGEAVTDGAWLTGKLGEGAVKITIVGEMLMRWVGSVQA
ncbi:hypothetical protein ACU8V3_12005 [Cobetia marina]